MSRPRPSQARLHTRGPPGDKKAEPRPYPTGRPQKKKSPVPNPRGIRRRTKAHPRARATRPAEAPTRPEILRAQEVRTPPATSGRPGCLGHPGRTQVDPSTQPPRPREPQSRPAPNPPGRPQTAEAAVATDGEPRRRHERRGEEESKTAAGRRAGDKAAARFRTLHCATLRLPSLAQDLPERRPPSQWQKTPPRLRARRGVWAAAADIRNCRWPARSCFHILPVPCRLPSHIHLFVLLLPRPRTRIQCCSCFCFVLARAV